MIKRAYDSFYEHEAYAIQEKWKKKDYENISIACNNCRRKKNYSFENKI